MSRISSTLFAASSCEYCRGPLGVDTSGLCAGCGAPRTKPVDLAAVRRATRNQPYGSVLESVQIEYEPRLDTVNTVQQDASTGIWHINGRPVVPQPGAERR